MGRMIGSHCNRLRRWPSNLYIGQKGSLKSSRLSGKPLDVPLARALDVFDYNVEGIEIERRHSVEGYVQEDQGPFEEGIGGIGCFARLAGHGEHRAFGCLTPSNTVDLVLDKKVD